MNNLNRKYSDWLDYGTHGNKSLMGIGLQLVQSSSNSPLSNRDSLIKMKLHRSMLRIYICKLGLYRVESVCANIVAIRFWQIKRRTHLWIKYVHSCTLLISIHESHFCKWYTCNQWVIRKFSFRVISNAFEL